MSTGNSILSSYGTTIFEVMSRLAQKHDAVNLGQGFPDGNGPDDVVEAGVDYLRNGVNQYPSMFGIPDLRQSVAEHAARFYNLDIDWQTETMVTSGGTEALGASLLGLIEPGDEVILIEPLYDSYLPIVQRGGGVAKLVRLEAPDWALPRADLEAAFSDKTKLILVNTPMNPCAKVFDRDDLEFIATLCQKHDAFAVCDEVYEHLAFDGEPHIPMITLPGMRDRTVRIQSAGKIFSLTGWKVGMITSAPEVLTPIAKAHQYLTFTTPPNLQAAVAFGLRKDDAYFEELNCDMQARRDHLAGGLRDIGFDVIPCQGTYFLTTDFRPLGYKGVDTEFCKHLTVEAGVAAVPISAFYTSGEEGYFARFSFCKKAETIDEALRRLKIHFS
ncbi:MAG: aminotransferase [Rhodospirillaceae bacterium]|nr:MAG: aminotransferase [Rhodospirillaceae bacterium TMED63]RPG00150.1 MAG: aminotransferase [Rhodospirillaceae bacterium TMED63]RZO35494.1 MAG: aminotransferase [Rhodospirillaceae bacterium]